MVFKRLELYGFKSFCDRTVLDMEPGLTVIVGPNGCGKSNIVDAVRWVLGEQSIKALRGSRFEDMIFNGTEERPPLGYVEATLTLDNAWKLLPVDYDEVSVTRRTFRSGETEYLINKTRCRLKDVLELFMDTGIGAHAYSLISQGQVDTMLSSKPEERRTLFDEAAGIAKYKARRRVARRKLEVADNNLLRLGDIVHEVARQMRSLKRQVGAATRYSQYEKELRELETRTAFAQYSSLRGQEKNLNRAISEVKGEQDSARASLSGEEAAREQLGLDLLECDRQLVASREKVHTIDSKMDKLEGQTLVLKERLKAASETRNRAAQNAEELRLASEKLQAEIDSVGEKRQKLFDQSKEARAMLEQKERKINELTKVLEEGEQAVEKFRSTVVQATDERAAVAARVESLASNLRRTDARIRDVSERESSVRSRLADCLKSHEKCTQEIRERESRLRDFEERHEALRHILSRKIPQRNALERELNSAKEQRAEKRSRLESLRELHESYEGFYAGARALLMARKGGEDHAKGVAGSLAELIRVEKRYETAIEMALGEHVQTVVTESVSDTERCIDVLKRTAAGRATFISVDAATSFAERYNAERNQAQAEGAQRCCDLVTCDSRYRPIVEALLGDCVVVDTLQHAMNLRINGANRVVTFDGELVLPCGAVTVGKSGGPPTGLLARAREITELEEAVTILDRDLETKRDRLARFAAEITDIDEQVLSIRSDFEKEQAELAEVRRKFYRQDEEKKRYESELEAFAAEKVELANQLEQLQREHAEANDLLAAAERQNRDYEHRISEQHERISKRRAEMANLTNEITELKVTLTAVEQLISSLESERARMTNARRDAIRQGRGCSSEVENASNDVAEITRAVEQTERSAQELMEERAAAKNAVADNEQHRQAILEKIDAAEATLKEKRTRIQQLQERSYRLEIELNRITERIEALIARIQSEYDVDLAALSEEEVGVDELDEDERAQRAATLKRRLQLMGPVNLRAVEEFNELKERHEFLLAQQRDLIKAKESLLQIIRKINESAETMFMETFSAIQAHFHEIFRRLFNGGMARLTLADETDILECGIEIEVRPPGKRLQSISLLSGGESTLTAIALLFAIFRAKRSPFCILDEVDAALDEANTMRFVELLDEFQEQTQLVIITHNKRTMERAGALYGVTMEERGVSQIVSVRLHEEALA